jgi:hypothetical protein
MHQCVQIERHACDDPKVWNLPLNWPNAIKCQRFSNTTKLPLDEEAWSIMD